MSEDCLNLNVWAPEPSGAPLPVLVWVHGGAFIQGAGSSPEYDGAKLAKGGAVVVTINYRLGPLGFLAHERLTREGGGESGNYGVQDVICALRWVQTNALAFGGDPGRVTVFGQSAGGAMGRVLLVSPPARGLFHRVIMQSGPAGHLPHLTRPAAYMPPAEEFGADLAERVLGAEAAARPSVLRALREVDAAVIVEQKGGRADVLDESYTYGPVIGGTVLPDDPFALMAQGLHANVPVIVGSNEDEGAAFASQFPTQTVREFREWLTQEYGAQARALQTALGPVRTSEAARAARIRLFGDERFVMIARLGARQLSDSGSAPVFLYTFTRGNATHGSEVPYVFGGVSGRNQTLSQTMASAWIRFAATGDPSGGGLSWPRYQRSGDRHLVFDAQITTGSGLRASTCDPLEESFLLERGLPTAR